MPEGVVTLLLADLEESTALWERHPEAMGAALGNLDALIDETCSRHRGVRPRDEGEGDSFLLAFARPSDGLACAWALREAFASQKWPADLRLRFRMELHAGEVEARDDGRYVGTALARCARVRDLAHGGQLVLTSALHGLMTGALPPGSCVREHGSYPLRGLEQPERVIELLGEGDGERALREEGACAPDLPEEPGPLIGRSAECERVRELLDRSSLVTLVGAGSSGKTRLALRLGHERSERHPDGAFRVAHRARRGGHAQDRPRLAPRRRVPTGIHQRETGDVLPRQSRGHETRGFRPCPPTGYICLVLNEIRSLGGWVVEIACEDIQAKA